MVLPLMLGDNATLSWSCPHPPGTFKVNATMSATELGKNVAILGDTVAPLVACPGIPPSGIAPCLYPTGTVGTSVLKTEGGVPGVKWSDFQIATNGFPALPPTAVTTKVTTTA